MALAYSINNTQPNNKTSLLVSCTPPNWPCTNLSLYPYLVPTFQRQSHVFLLPIICFELLHWYVDSAEINIRQQPVLVKHTQPQGVLISRPAVMGAPCVNTFTGKAMMLPLEAPYRDGPKTR